MKYAKLWSDQTRDSADNGRRVLFVHGFLDNCASFDRLVPLLDGRNKYLCVDMPGHGFSSGPPEGTRWSLENYALTILRVMEHLRWPTCTCVGHSMGGQICKLFAAIYPERVDGLVLLDAAGPVAVRLENITGCERQALDELLRLEDRAWTDGSRRRCTAEEAWDRVKHRMYGSVLDDESARSLLSRHLLPDRGDGHPSQLANDPRTRVSYSQWFSVAQHRDVVARIRCPTLQIRADESDAYHEHVYSDFVRAYRSNPRFRFVRVEGNHDVHMTYPHRVAAHVNGFLNEDRRPGSKL